MGYSTPSGAEVHFIEQTVLGAWVLLRLGAAQSMMATTVYAAYEAVARKGLDDPDSVVRLALGLFGEGVGDGIAIFRSRQ